MRFCFTSSLSIAAIVLGAIFSLPATAANVALQQTSSMTLGAYAATHSNVPGWILIPVFGVIALALAGLVFFVKRTERGSVPGMRAQWSNDCFREQMRERALRARSH